MSRNAYLILENGTVFEGKAFGAEKETMGELVFTTSMVGYLETITDPSYFGQVVFQTFPLIGNYGVISADLEYDTPMLIAYIVREWCQVPSNFRSEGNLDTFLKEKGIPGICGIDTRALTRIIRDNGVLNCKVAYSNEVTDELLEEIKNYKITGAVESTTIKEKEEIKADKAKYNVVLMDFGVRNGADKVLVSKGCNVTAVPAGTTAEEILALNPDGIMLSNGPADPTENTAIIEEIKKLCDSNKPMFAIGLGHQLLALAKGAKTEKLLYGHRGASQPVKYIGTDKVFITSQNQGYAVVTDSLPVNAQVSFRNSNDNVCEGINYTDTPAFSVQFNIETCGGPQDTSFLYDRFIEMLNENK